MEIITCKICADYGHSSGECPELSGSLYGKFGEGAQNGGGHDHDDEGCEKEQGEGQGQGQGKENGVSERLEKSKKAEWFKNHVFFRGLLAKL